jgi:hypothetical protein
MTTRLLDADFFQTGAYEGLKNADQSDTSRRRLE